MEPTNAEVFEALHDAAEAIDAERAEGDPVFSRDLRYDLKKPCADCPFLKAAPFHAGVAKSLPDYHDKIRTMSFGHTCHKTDPRPECDGPPDRHGPVQHCRGALICLTKTGDGADLQLPLLQAAEDGRLDLEELAAQAAADAEVFTFPEMLGAYLDWLAGNAQGCNSNPIPLTILPLPPEGPADETRPP